MSQTFSPNGILRHLRQYLPQLTSLFSEQPSVTGEIIDGDPQVLRITESSHGRTAGATVLVINAVIPNAITGVSAFSDPDGTEGLRFTTEAGHDLTAGTTSPSTVTLTGFANAALNDSFTVYDVPSSTVFEIVTSEVVPVLSGSERILEQWNLGPQGYRTISTVIDPDTYDIELSGLPAFSEGALESIQVVTSWRIALAQDIERAEEMYTKQDSGKEWLYLVMEGAPTSKDWDTDSDATSTATAQNDQKLKIINGFSFISVFSTTDQLTAEDAIETSWTTVLYALWSALFGYAFAGPGEKDYVAVPTDHGPARYAKAYYAHTYAFEFTYEINFEQGYQVAFPETRAFRESVIDIDPLDVVS